MLIASIIVAFLLGIVVTLLAQYAFLRRWYWLQPTLKPPYKQQHPNYQLPQVLLRAYENHKYHQTRDSGVKGDNVKSSQTTAVKGDSVKANQTASTKVDNVKVTQIPKVSQAQVERKDLSLVLNLLMQFLFAEVKDTARVRRWAARKLNAEFDEMLATTTGKFLNQIQVRDFNFGTTFPIVKCVELRDVQLKDEFIETVDVDLDIDYDGGFQITLDVDLIFGAWAYLSITVSRLAGRCRLQLSRQPFTHWSLAFYEDPEMEFQVDSRFNGRPIPQISSLIVNQIKRTIRKKHILPSYKMRYKPLFQKAENGFINPDLCFRGNKLGRGKLTVKVIRCSRLQDLSPDSKLYCTLSVDKEDMEEVWRQSWSMFDLTIRAPQGTNLGLKLTDQVPGERANNNKKQVLVENITHGSAAYLAGLQRGDIVEHIGNVRVLSMKHAVKEIRNSGEIINLRVRRHMDRYLPDEIPYEGPPLTLEEGDGCSDIPEDDFVNICLTKPTVTSDNQLKPVDSSKPVDKPNNRKRAQNLLLNSKKLLLGTKETREGEKDGRPFPVLRRKSATVEDEALRVVEGGQVPGAIPFKDRSQSAKSSPQKTIREINRQRAHSDTSLNKKVEVDSSSLPGDLSHAVTERRVTETRTRELSFSREPEWNEEFEFECTDEDQFVNVCVWGRVAQHDRLTKPATTTAKTDPLSRNTPPSDDLPQFDVKTKIGYVSVPLADIVAGCLLTLQGDTQYTVYLHPPEETITASRTKLPYSGHPGFDRTICQGDITLSFIHEPFKKLEREERRKIMTDILSPQSQPVHVVSPKKELEEGKHNFVGAQLPSGTYCQFCGKKIWFKGALHCVVCQMVCHKKCADKCQVQTWCTKDGPRQAEKITEAWVTPVRRSDSDDKESRGTGAGIFRKLRNKEQAPSLPLNIPSRSTSGRFSPTPSPNKSPLRSPGPFGALGDYGDGEMRRNHSYGGIDKFDEDSDDESSQRSRHQLNYNLDVVIEAKEKGKELYADLSLPERKKTLDDMITKLQDTIDKESEQKAEMTRCLQETSDQELRRSYTQQIEKCDEKMDALMMMMVHYCAGLQHCLDQEEAHRRMQSLHQLETGSHDDMGIQFIVTDTTDEELDLVEET